jgi:hypothetical protein
VTRISRRARWAAVGAAGVVVLVGGAAVIAAFTATPEPPPTTARSTTNPASTATPTGRPATFPDGSNTGVPDGTTLTAWTGGCTITTAQTIVGKRIDCPQHLTVQAKVTIRDSLVVGGVWLDTDQAASSDWSLTIIDSEVDGTTQQVAAICCGNVDLTRVNAHGGVTAVQCEEGSTGCSVEDSWLHGQYIQPDSNWHLGGFLSDGGGPITLTHNTVVCDQPAVYGSDGGCTGDINLIPNFAPAHDVTIDGNFFGANKSSAYCTYGGTRSDANGKGPAVNIVYRNNVFERGETGKCAGYGPVNGFDSAAVGAVWTNNLYDDGTPVAPAN